MALINCLICLSDIPKDKIKVFNESGKKYLPIVVSDLREKDAYGNTHSIYVSQTREEREARKRIYLGNGKAVNFNRESHPRIDDVANLPTATSSDDLPF